MSITKLELHCLATIWQVVVIDRYIRNWFAGREGEWLCIHSPVIASMKMFEESIQ
jgi:hypothetical protein